MPFCTWVLPLEYIDKSHIAKLQNLITNLVLSFCFITSKYKQKASSLTF